MHNKRIGILTVRGNPIAIDLFVLLSKEHKPFMLYTENINASLRFIYGRKRGLRWYLYTKLFSSFAQKYRVGHIPKRSWEDLESECAASFAAVEDHNSEACKMLLEKQAIDLGVLIGTTIIKPDVFTIPTHGMINLHMADLQEIRGVPPAYWEHKTERNRMGVTIHKVVERLDAGEILELKYIAILGGEHYVETKFRANEICAELLFSGVLKSLSGEVGKVPLKIGKLYTIPGYVNLVRDYFALIMRN